MFGIGLAIIALLVIILIMFSKTATSIERLEKKIDKAFLIKEQQREVAKPSVTEKPKEPTQPVMRTEPRVVQQPAPKPPSPPIVQKQSTPTTATVKKAQPSQPLEMKLGIYGAIIVGGIALIVGLLFLVKNAFTPFLTTPQGKLTVITATGLVFLIIGEITRRRSYGYVAKSATAIGFALLYAAVFSAYGYFDLLGSTVAFGLAIIITAGALTYAVSLNEVIMAVLAMLGGYLSPYLLSTNENRPHALFIYVAILSIGAMACSVFRKWKVVKILAFIGYAVLFSGWFTKFYSPDQSSLALSYLWFFTLIFLAIPVLHELIKKTTTSKEAALLIVFNALLAFVYHLRIIDQTSFLTAAVLSLSAIHLLMFFVVQKRCPDDKKLLPVLLSVSLFLLTAAVVIYFKIYGIVITLSAISVVEALIASKYRSKVTQAFSFISIIIASVNLLRMIPFHRGDFNLAANVPFVSAISLAAAFYLLHLIHRTAKKGAITNSKIFSSFLFLIFAFVLSGSLFLEWTDHLTYNLNITFDGYLLEYLAQTLVVLLSLSIVLLVVRPVSPGDMFCLSVSSVLTVIGAFAAPFVLYIYYGFDSLIFANREFLISLIFVSALLLASLIIYKQSPKDNQPRISISIFNLFLAVVLGLIILTIEIYTYWNNLAGHNPARYDHFSFLGQMYISVAWAIYASVLIFLGFWKKSKLLRYTALALYGLLILKVFVFDMSELESVYRIAGLIVLGLALIAVSFVYQYNKKKGLFADTKHN